jgi:hypothetical protein
MILASNTQQHNKTHKNKIKGKAKQTPKKGRQNIKKYIGKKIETK